MLSPFELHHHCLSSGCHLLASLPLLSDGGVILWATSMSIFYEILVLLLIWIVILWAKGVIFWATSTRSELQASIPELMCAVTLWTTGFNLWATLLTSKPWTSSVAMNHPLSYEYFPLRHHALSHAFIIYCRPLSYWNHWIHRSAFKDKVHKVYSKK